MSRTGAPKKEIDFSQFEKLCGLQCTLTEISGFFDVSEDTIERRCKEQYKMTFAEAYKKHSHSGRISLRRYQFDMAKKNPTMAIWLGKQYLGQMDKQEISMPDGVDVRSITILPASQMKEGK